jgi:hypothetical protein
MIRKVGAISPRPFLLPGMQIRNSSSCSFIYQAAFASLVESDTKTVSRSITHLSSQAGAAATADKKECMNLE